MSGRKIILLNICTVISGTILAFMLFVCTSQKFSLLENSYAEEIDQEDCYLHSSAIVNDDVKYTKTIEIETNSQSIIQHVYYVDYNFEGISYEISNNYIRLFVYCRYHRYDYYANIIIRFKNGTFQEKHIYLFNTQYGSFYSFESESNTLSKFKDYIYNNNIRIDNKTEEDILALSNKHSSENMRGNKDTYVEGKLRWLNSNNVYKPLRWIRVQAYDANSVGGDTLLGTTYTDQNGDYSITFQNNDSIFDNWGSDVYIVIRAMTTADIWGIGSALGIYNIMQGTYENIQTGDTAVFNYDFDMTDNISKTMQILQAAMVGEYYAELMMGSVPTNVAVYYPCPLRFSEDQEEDNVCFYDNGIIYIVDSVPANGCPHTYECWDVITHEYGHHISYEVGNINSPGGSHYVGEQLAVSRTKDEAIRIAWAEAWATAFGLIAQKTYPYTISTIPTVCDNLYTSDQIQGENIEMNQWTGEIREDAIVEILWDIYDSSNESYDALSLSYANWWNITTISGTYTFSQFAQFFYFYYPNDIDKLGALLETHNIAASDITSTTTALSCSPPTISWNSYCGWAYYDYDLEEWIYPSEGYLDKFNIEIRGEGTNEVIYKNNLLTTSYTFTQSEWNTIISWTGISFEVIIGSYHSSVTPQTGIYYSEGVWFSKPTYLTTYIDNNSALEITGLKNTALVNVIIPEAIAGVPVKNIGASAFANNTTIMTITIRNNIEYVGANAFLGCSNLTIYCGVNLITTWASTWNSSNRPVFSFCFFDDSYTYITSFLKGANNPGSTYSGTINKPIRSGYTFDVWYTNADYTGDYYTMANINSAPNGMLYAKWNSNSSGSCITTGSLITLADGTQTAVENLTGNEQLLVWDMLNGTFTSAPILFIDSEITTTYDVITLTFSDNTQVEVIDEHAFFDTTLNKYVFLRSDAAQYIGHYFKKQSYDINNNMTLANVQLIDVSISQQVTTAYSPVTYGHLCYYVNGMLSMPGNTESFINIFDVDVQTMAYDQTSMAQDIATYGLYTYAEFNNIIPIPELVFNAFNGQYLKVAIGKGITTLQEIQNLLNRYMSFFE